MAQTPTQFDTLPFFNEYFKIPYCTGPIGWAEGSADGPTDGRTDLRTDGRTDRRTDGHTLL